jgi:hypothetical protein
MFCRSLFVLFLLTSVSYVLYRFTASDYSFGFFKLSFHVSSKGKNPTKTGDELGCSERVNQLLCLLFTTVVLCQCGTILSCNVSYVLYRFTASDYSFGFFKLSFHVSSKGNLMHVYNFSHLFSRLYLTCNSFKNQVKSFPITYTVIPKLYTSFIWPTY